MTSRSLRWRLRWLVIGALACVLVPLGILSLYATLDEVDELSDGRLAQSARTLQLLLHAGGLQALDDKTGVLGRQPMTVPPGGREFESEVAFEVTDARGQLRMATSNFARFPLDASLASGFSDLTYQGHHWRVYTACDVSGICVRAGERYDSRTEILQALLLDHMLPIILGLPLIALLVGWAVQRGLRPLDSLAALLQARAPGSHEPVRLEAAPAELRPVVLALNAQFTRLEDALERERRFSADVAHELRTPIAASLIGVEAAIQDRSRKDAALALGQAHEALNRLSRRVEQLLVLARLESGAAATPRERVDLVPVAMQVVEEVAAVFADRLANLSLDLPSEEIEVLGHPAGLRALMRNLVENALRHVDEDGHVALTVRRSGDAALIEVSDDGPGIPPERRPEVFSRFHREPGGSNEGYGLGLSIVHRVAELHAATIELLDGPSGRGLLVRITLRAI